MDKQLERELREVMLEAREAILQDHEAILQDFWGAHRAACEAALAEGTLPSDERARYRKALEGMDRDGRGLG